MAALQCPMSIIYFAKLLWQNTLGAKRRRKDWAEIKLRIGGGGAAVITY